MIHQSRVFVWGVGKKNVRVVLYTVASVIGFRGNLVVRHIFRQQYGHKDMAREGWFELSDKRIREDRSMVRDVSLIVYCR